MIHDSSWCPYENIYSSFECSVLKLVGLFSVDRHHFEAFISLERIYLFCDLCRKLSRRSKDKRLYFTTWGELLYQRNTKSCSFSGTGRCLSYDIFFSLKEKGNNFFLGRRWRKESFFRQCCQCFFSDSEIFEFYHV